MENNTGLAAIHVRRLDDTASVALTGLLLL
jgi:hypothetical protein